MLKEHLISEASERQQLMGAGTGASVSLSAAVDTLANYGKLTAVEANPMEITIGGESAERNKVIDYARALEKLGIFSGVRIAAIDENQAGDGGGILFSIVLAR